MKPKTPTLEFETAPAYDLDAVRQRYLNRKDKDPPRIENRNDGVDWARRIVARVEAGEPVDLQVEIYAREALGLPLGRLGE